MVIHYKMFYYYLAQSVFKNYDHDQDGYISQEEFEKIAASFPFSFCVMAKDWWVPSPAYLICSICFGRGLGVLFLNFTSIIRVVKLSSSATKKKKKWRHNWQTHLLNMLWITSSWAYTSGNQADIGGRTDIRKRNRDNRKRNSFCMIFSVYY